jgi:protease-4
MIARIASLVCISTVLACQQPAPAETPPAPASPGMPGLGPLAGMFASKLDEPGPYEEPKASADQKEGEPAVAIVKWSGQVSEVAGVSLFAGATTPLRTLTTQLAELAARADTPNILVRVDDFSIEPVAAEELRAAMLATRKAGKTIACFADGWDGTTYHLATACDQIGLAPLGTVSITGPAATPIHVKGLLDRLGVFADFLNVGAFKGAAEPLTRDAPSPEMLETLGAIVESRWRSQKAAIASGRGLDDAAAAALVDGGLYTAEAAKAAKLVDEVATWADFRDRVRGTTPWRKIASASPMDKLGDFTALQRFLGVLPPDRPSEPHVALVYAVGNIVDGSGSGLVGAREEIASHTLVAALEALTKDDKVKAVVLRVDSGGGSALASEQIWHAASDLAASKPLVVSMGGVAASGGYYISAPAAKIYAGADTLTGSIGVVGGKIVVGDALANLGVRSYEVHRGKRAMLWSAMQRWNDDERSTIAAMMQDTYDVFVDRVATGRKLGKDDVQKVAAGRVWTGNAAREHGLVDEIGTLEAAIVDAHARAGLEPTTALEVYPPEPTLRDLLTSFGSVQTSASLTELAPLAAIAREASFGDDAAGAARGVVALLRSLAALQNARIWAASPWVFWRV